MGSIQFVLNNIFFIIRIKIKTHSYYCIHYRNWEWTRVRGRAKSSLTIKIKTVTHRLNPLGIQLSGEDQLAAAGHLTSPPRGLRLASI